MRSAILFVLVAALVGIAQAADSPQREALISRVETQYTSASILREDSPILDLMLVSAHPLNPEATEATWKTVRTQVAAALTSTLTKQGGALDIVFRNATSTMSDADLKRLSSLLADPVYRKFQGSISGAENQKQLMQTLMQTAASIADAVNGVLEKNGLKVPH